MLKPPLKWPGNKISSVARVVAELPARLRYYEPMCGSCAVGLNYPHAKSYMFGDSNPDLMNLYNHLLRGGENFINQAKAMFAPLMNEEGRYYEERGRFNKLPVTECQRAILFLYLNRHCYNGLVRYNLDGKWNVPFGKYKKPYFPKQELRNMAAWAKEKRVQFCRGGYEQMLCEMADSNSLVYLDPPFWPTSKTANFTAYDGKRFGEEQQRELLCHVHYAVRKGAVVAVSNADVEVVREMYADARIVSYEARRSISCQGDGRKKTGEILAIFGDVR
jgi:DNA adenine methylase